MLTDNKGIISKTFRVKGSVPQTAHGGWQREVDDFTMEVSLQRQQFLIDRFRSRITNGDAWNWLIEGKMGSIDGEETEWGRNAYPLEIFPIRGLPESSMWYRRSRKEAVPSIEPMITRLREETVDPGYQLSSEPDFLRLWTEQPHAWIEAWSDHSTDHDILAKILYMLSHEPMSVASQQLAHQGLLHSSSIVQEMAISAFESWRGREALEALQAFRSQDSWLQDYAQMIVQELRKEIAAHGLVSAQNYEK